MRPQVFLPPFPPLRCRPIQIDPLLPNARSSSTQRVMCARIYRVPSLPFATLISVPSPASGILLLLLQLLQVASNQWHEMEAEGKQEKQQVPAGAAVVPAAPSQKFGFISIIQLAPSPLLTLSRSPWPISIAPSAMRTRRGGPAESGEGRGAAPRLRKGGVKKKAGKGVVLAKRVVLQRGRSGSRATEAREQQPRAPAGEQLQQEQEQRSDGVATRDRQEQQDRAVKRRRSAAPGSEASSAGITHLSSEVLQEVFLQVCQHDQQDYCRCEEGAGMRWPDLNSGASGDGGVVVLADTYVMPCPPLAHLLQGGLTPSVQALQGSTAGAQRCVGGKWVLTYRLGRPGSIFQHPAST